MYKKFPGGDILSMCKMLRGAGIVRILTHPEEKKRNKDKNKGNG